jgi:sucrose-6-phosphate hydrolase SacC (GH32 family)
MEEGQVVYVSSGKDGYRLGEFLVDSGDLIEEALAVALERSKSSGVSLSRYLTENSMIAADRLTQALEQLVEKILIEVFISRKGTVSVTSPLPEIIRNSPIRLETGRIVSDALRIFDEMNRNILTD